MAPPVTVTSSAEAAPMKPWRRWSVSASTSDTWVRFRLTVPPLSAEAEDWDVRSCSTPDSAGRSRPGARPGSLVEGSGEEGSRDRRDEVEWEDAAPFPVALLRPEPCLCALCDSAGRSFTRASAVRPALGAGRVSPGRFGRTRDQPTAGSRRRGADRGQTRSAGGAWPARGSAVVAQHVDHHLDRRV